MTTASDPLAQQLIALLQVNDEKGLSDQQISAHFGPHYTALAPIINAMLSSNRLQLFTQGGILIYKIVREEIAAKFDGLGPEQIMIYQVCEKAGNRLV
jgi:AraC-like DNA-binding protein